MRLLSHHFLLCPIAAHLLSIKGFQFNHVVLLTKETCLCLPSVTHWPVLLTSQSDPYPIAVLINIKHKHTWIYFNIHLLSIAWRYRFPSTERNFLVSITRLSVDQRLLLYSFHSTNVHWFQQTFVEYFYSHMPQDPDSQDYWYILLKIFIDFSLNGAKGRGPDAGGKKIEFNHDARKYTMYLSFDCALCKMHGIHFYVLEALFNFQWKVKESSCQYLRNQ